MVVEPLTPETLEIERFFVYSFTHTERDRCICTYIFMYHVCLCMCRFYMWKWCVLRGRWYFRHGSFLAVFQMSDFADRISQPKAAQRPQCCPRGAWMKKFSRRLWRFSPVFSPKNCQSFVRSLLKTIGCWVFPIFFLQIFQFLRIFFHIQKSPNNAMNPRSPTPGVPKIDFTCGFMDVYSLKYGS